MDDNIISAADMMAKLFGDLYPQAKSANKMISAWRESVSRITDVGEGLVAHTRVIDAKDGVLFIQTDHPSWAQLLQLHSAFILKGLSFTVPEENIKALVFRTA